MSTNHIIYANKFSTDIERFKEVAENKGLGEDELRVFMFLCCRVGSCFIVNIDKKQIAKSLNMKEKKVKKAFEVLEEYGIITKDRDDHNKKGYLMSYTGDNEIMSGEEFLK